MALILDGKEVARRVRDEVSARVDALGARGLTPGLALVRVGEDPASESYVRGKHRMCEKVGIRSEVRHEPADVGPRRLHAILAELNRRDDVHGILLQLPLPDGYDENEFLLAIDPDKDVDGFHPINAGRLAQGLSGFVPCTPLGIQRLLVEHGIEIPGARVVVVGRSNIVGRPVATLLSQKGPHADATVTICHSRSRDLADLTRSADILIAAIGRPRFITADMVGKGSVVVDVGIHRVDDPDGPRIVGDVAFDEVEPRVRAISPVPGGVGKMTVAMLLANTVTAAERRSAARP